MKSIVGIIPAAGAGSRISPLPMSKELFPIGYKFFSNGKGGLHLPKPVSHYLIDSMIEANVSRISFIINKEKWDIPKYYGNGHDLGVSISYLIQQKLAGMPYALDAAYQWVQNDTVLFGMPDTITSPNDSFVQLLEFHERNRNALTLGLFATDQPSRFGMVSFNQSGSILKIIDKPQKTELKYMWGIACWGPAFTHFLHEYLRKIQGCAKEVLLGDIFQAFLDSGERTKAYCFDGGKYMDIGTPTDLKHIIHQFSEE